MEYFQECFWVWVMFLDLGGDSDWVRVGWWCVSLVCMFGFLDPSGGRQLQGKMIFWILGSDNWRWVMVIDIGG